MAVDIVAERVLEWAAMMAKAQQQQECNTAAALHCRSNATTVRVQLLMMAQKATFHRSVFFI